MSKISLILDTVHVSLYTYTQKRKPFPKCMIDTNLHKKMIQYKPDVWCPNVFVFFLRIKSWFYCVKNPIPFEKNVLQCKGIINCLILGLWI